MKSFWVCVCACMNIYMKILYIHMDTHLSFQYVEIFHISLSKLTGAVIHSTDEVN